MTKGTESSRLAAFLLALQTSRSAQRRFKANPRAEMKRFDLSAKTIKAIRDGDAYALWVTLTRVPGHVGVVIAHVGVATGQHKRRRRPKHKKT